MELIKEPGEIEQPKLLHRAVALALALVTTAVITTGVVSVVAGNIQTALGA